MASNALVIFVLFLHVSTIIPLYVHGVELLTKNYLSKNRPDSFHDTSSWYGSSMKSSSVEKPSKYEENQKSSKSGKFDLFGGGNDHKKFLSEIQRYKDYITESFSPGKGVKDRGLVYDQENSPFVKFFGQSKYSKSKYKQSDYKLESKVSLIDCIYRLLTLYSDIQKLIRAYPDKSIYENLRISVYEVIDELIHDRFPRMIHEMIMEMRHDRMKKGGPTRSKKAVDGNTSRECEGKGCMATGSSEDNDDLAITGYVKDLFQRPQFTWSRADSMEVSSDKVPDSRSNHGFEESYESSVTAPDWNPRGVTPIYNQNVRSYDERPKTRKPIAAPIQEVGNTDWNKNHFGGRFVDQEDWQNPAKRDTSLVAHGINHEIQNGGDVSGNHRHARYASVGKTSSNSASVFSENANRPVSSEGPAGIAKSEGIQSSQQTARSARSVEPERSNGSVKFAISDERGKSEKPDESARLANVPRNFDEPATLNAFAEFGKSDESERVEDSGRFQRSEEFRTFGKLGILENENSEQSESTGKSENLKKIKVVAVTSEKSKGTGKPAGFEDAQMIDHSERSARSLKIERLHVSEEAPKLAKLAGSEDSDGSEKSPRPKNAKKMVEPLASGGSETFDESNEFNDRFGNIQKFHPTEGSAVSAKISKLKRQITNFEKLGSSESFERSEKSGEREDSTRLGKPEKSSSERFKKLGESEKFDGFDDSSDSTAEIVTFFLNRLEEIRKEANRLPRIDPRNGKVIERPPTSDDTKPL